MVEWPRNCPHQSGMRALPQNIKRTIPALLSMMLLIASGMDCMAQPSGMMAAGCCKHAPCKRSPGQAPHSSCEVQPANHNVVLPASCDLSRGQVTLAANGTISNAVTLPLLSGHVARGLHRQYSPPDLFLQNSSFLI